MTKIQEYPISRYDLTGRVFTRLTVKGFNHTRKHQSYWTCICECGNVSVVARECLIKQETKSCGCYRKDIFKLKHSHGDSAGNKTKEYRTWIRMKMRCYNKNHLHYSSYGGRGISICERWLISYENFILDMGRAPSRGHSIDRKNVNGNYQPDNCRWATKAEQANNKRCTIYLEINGVKKRLGEWCEHFRISYSTAYQRIHVSKWDPVKALTTPVRPR